MDTATLLWGVLFSSIGLGYFLYGKKQHSGIPFACGLCLIIYPYFMPNNIMLVIVGMLLSAIPYFVRL